MKIIKLKPLSEIATNSYIVCSDDKNAVLIDAPADADYIISQLKENGLTLKKILLTHGHIDHTGAVYDLAEKTECEVYIHSGDNSKLYDADLCLSNHLGISFKPYRSAKALENGDIITQDELKFEVISTPGHTSGSVCYICDDVMFSGDTLFYRSVGRTDMIDGDSVKLIESLKKLKKINFDYTVYSGHGTPTSLSDEKALNPYMGRLA